MSPLAPEPPPPILYRYYSPERLDVLETLMIRFNPPSKFNDTFDSDFRSPRPDPRVRFKHLTQLGIYCLTAEPDNHLMWVNYAQQHRGYVIGFDMTNGFWSQIGAVPSLVTYVDGPPKVPSGGTPSVELSLTKSTVWGYEKEWRAVRGFDPKESRDIAFPSQMVSELIIGSKMETHHIARLLDIADAYSKEGPIAVFESKPDRNTWSFTHVPTPKRLCNTCDGRGYTTH